MNAFRGGRGMALLIVTLVLEGGEWPSWPGCSTPSNPINEDGTKAGLDEPREMSPLIQQIFFCDDICHHSHCESVASWITHILSQSLSIKTIVKLCFRLYVSLPCGLITWCCPAKMSENLRNFVTDIRSY